MQFCDAVHRSHPKRTGMSDNSPTILNLSFFPPSFPRQQHHHHHEGDGTTCKPAPTTHARMRTICVRFQKAGRGGAANLVHVYSLVDVSGLRTILHRTNEAKLTRQGARAQSLANSSCKTEQTYRGCDVRQFLCSFTLALSPHQHGTWKVASTCGGWDG